MRRSCSVLATSVLYRLPSFGDFSFSCPLLFEPLIQFGPVIAGATLSCLIRQHADNIDNGEVPFFFLIAPCSTNRLILKELKVFSAAHADTPPEQVYVV